MAISTHVSVAYRDRNVYVRPNNGACNLPPHSLKNLYVNLPPQKWKPKLQYKTTGYK